MNDSRRRLFYLVVLSIIWGSSYILIKKGLEGFTALQLWGVRVLMAGLILLGIGFGSLKTISRQQWKWVGLSGLLGSFIPMFLFAWAETEIDSGVVSILNSLVPLFTIFVGYGLFRIAFTINQILGVIVGLAGAALMIYLGSAVNPDQNYWYTSAVVVASFCYAVNANIIKSKLQDVSPMGIATGNFVFLIGPALLIVIISGALSEPVREGPHFMSSLAYIGLLCVFGTAIAKVMFNRLIQISTPVFSVSTTYLIPIVGVFWGILDGERFSLGQGGAALLILFGIYLINKTKRAPRQERP
ncbi:DMT family transporter [Robiginitalea sp.]|uniref:DMT family transporter n=1 Tax=Robiginitalea sp. TaxID=1902411 RepID=UPI003C4B2425